MGHRARVVLVHWTQPARLTTTVDTFLASDGVEVAVTVVDNDSDTITADAA